MSYFALTPQDLRARFLRQPWVKVYNASGSVIAPFSVMCVTGENLSTNGDVVYTVVQPNNGSATAFYREYLVNGPLAINSADPLNWGYGTTLSEGGLVRLDSGTPTLGEVWGPSNGKWGLTQHFFGFYMYGGYTTVAGNTCGVAKQIGYHMVLGKTDGTLNKGSTQTVSVWAGTAGSESDTGMNITGVYNRFANVASGKWVMVGVNADQPYLISAEC